jgi:hypothetical protein
MQARHARRMLEEDVQEAKEALEVSDMERLRLRQDLEDELRNNENLKRECSEYKLEIASMKLHVASLEQRMADNAQAAEERMQALQGMYIMPENR